MLEDVDWRKTADIWTVIGGIAGVAAAIVGGVALGDFFYKRWQARMRAAIATRLGLFLDEGAELIEKINRLSEPPDKECKNWINRLDAYMKQLGSGYSSRLKNFSGMTFFSGGDGKAKIRNSVDGRMRRLHEFIAEITNR